MNTLLLERRRTKAILYQGGINRRLDWDLIRGISKRLPDWEFWLCGALAPHDRKPLRKLRDTHIKYLGYLSPEEIRSLSFKASVGIIPFLQNEMIRISLPLKAFEYLACGLPVVTVPIDSLKAYPSFFTMASSADEFARAIREVGDTGCDREAIGKRMQLAKEQDYDLRFAVLMGKLLTEGKHRQPDPSPFRIIVLHDADADMGVLREYMQCYAADSGSTVLYAAAGKQASCTVDLSVFDVVVFHDPIRLFANGQLSPSFAQAVRGFGGYKVIFLQQEHEVATAARERIAALGFHAMLTCVSPGFGEQVFPSARFPALERIQVWAGAERAGKETPAFEKPDYRDSVREFAGFLAARLQKRIAGTLIDTSSSNSRRAGFHGAFRPVRMWLGRVKRSCVKGLKRILIGLNHIVSVV
jgi:hypothetical protein